jgi:hypothetical protein
MLVTMRQESGVRSQETGVRSFERCWYHPAHRIPEGQGSDIVGLTMQCGVEDFGATQIFNFTPLDWFMNRHFFKTGWTSIFNPPAVHIFALFAAMAAAGTNPHSDSTTLSDWR